MVNENNNPFSVTKAAEFSDQEIFEYWVDFNHKENKSIGDILNPNEYLPKFVIGDKGCGKTHILRYFSYPLQKIRSNNDIVEALNRDKYLGIYSVFHGLNSSRFQGKGVEQEQWAAIFEYYFELYICDGLLHIIDEILTALQINQGKSGTIVSAITHLFNNYESLTNIRTLHDVIDYIKNLRRKIDIQVSNVAFTRKLDYDNVKIFFSPGDLLFGIPNVINANIPELNDTKFIFIFDEYEKLFEWQQQFINTLVWDKRTPVTFWIGARRYGYTTRATKSGEIMVSGSEFQEVNLDFIIRSNEQLYVDFAKKLYVNRLKKFYEHRNLKVDVEDIEGRFSSKFEDYNEEKILVDIIEKNKNKEYKHIKELRRKLDSAIKNGLAFGLEDVNKINDIVKGLVLNTQNNPLEQKYKVFFFYKLWYQGKAGTNLLSLVDHINAEYDKSLSKIKSEFDEIKDKRKKDLIAQLTKENNVKNTDYSGISKFIELSQGNARTFILILKKIIEIARLRGEKPLEEGSLISLDTQYLAVYDTGRWFYEDAELIGEDGKFMYQALKCLADYLMLYRFCDKPTETTVSCFYIKSADVSENTIKCIDLMKTHSILIELPGRIEKNSGRKERAFQLNKILAPLWNLPTAVRGILYLKMDVADSIFDSTKNVNFESLYKEKQSELNAPDFIRTKSKKPGTNLFN